MRSLPAAFAAAFGLTTVPKLVVLVRLNFDGGVMAWNNTMNDISYGGATYARSGALGSISGISESTGVKSAGVTVGISGVTQGLVAALLNEPYINRTASIHLALLGANDAFNAADVVQMFAGKIDSINGVQGATPSFSVSIRSRLSDWERSRSVKYTDSDQQRFYPGDLGMEYIPQLSQRKIIWPQAAFLPDMRD